MNYQIQNSLEFGDFAEISNDHFHSSNRSTTTKRRRRKLSIKIPICVRCYFKIFYFIYSLIISDSVQSFFKAQTNVVEQVFFSFR